MRMIGNVFDIQHFCTNDGPGIRTTVFLKGCPLECLWCHNPESRNAESEIMFFRDKCTGCGRCSGITTKDADFVCYAGAKKVCGRDMSPDAVLTEVMKDAVFYKNSGGGMTLSGGEPLYQHDFSRELLKLAKAQGIHTAVETCGFAKRRHLEAITEVTDLFLFDCKETDGQRHRAYTGADNAIIVGNLFMLDDMGKDIVLRCPIIPGYNDREDHFRGICGLANRLKNIRQVEIEPYHDLGVHKYAAVGRQAVEITPMETERICGIVKHIQEGTDVPVRTA